MFPKTTTLLSSILFLFYSILFYFILFYSILFSSLLFSSILFYSSLFSSIPFYSVLYFSFLFFFSFSYLPFFISSLLISSHIFLFLSFKISYLLTFDMNSAWIHIQTLSTNRLDAISQYACNTDIRRENHHEGKFVAHSR